MNLNQRIIKLENYVSDLLAKIDDLSKNVEEKTQKPFSVSGGIKNNATNMPVDAKTGLGQVLANHVIWNDSESKIPPLDEEPDLPTVGYNKHSHSRYSGGALIKDMLEIVEYDWGSIVNKHSQQFWEEVPDISTEINSQGHTVEKIGQLDLVFNPDTLKWGVSSFEIDVKKCYLVERDDDGNIATDSKGNEKKSLLYNSDSNKTAIIWDESAGCWRFFACYAPGE